MRTRQVQVDALKLIASQFILLHHFAAYGPLAEALSEAAPHLTDWFYDYARMAVQVFLVVGGYLAVSSLAPHGTAVAGPPWRQVLPRYRRLALPFMVAMLMAVISSLLARQWLLDEFIPAAPDWQDLLAHALLLHDLLGVDALSAGVWYVAIDFQLFVLLSALLWLGRHSAWRARVLVAGLALASLFYFNRDEGWDSGAVYFFGAYGMGAAAWWAGQARRSGRWLLVLGLVGLLALAVDFRGRIALALVTALLLGLLHWRHRTIVASAGAAAPSLAQALVARLGQTSYALFLVHFSVLMLGNAFFARLELLDPWTTGAVLVGSWMASMVLAELFHRWVEQPLARWRPTFFKKSKIF
jgi:peptidoglycan/LPS O-acetylase OafA/YrhL